MSTVVPFVTYSVDPLVVVGHLGVDAQLVLLAAALAPGHQTNEEPGVSVQSDHRPPAVPPTGVHPLAEDPGTEEVVCDVVGHVLSADAVADQRDLDDVERRAQLDAIQVILTPARHHGGGAVEVEHPLGQLASRQADGDDVLGQGRGGLQAEEGDVVVHHFAFVVVWVFEGLDDLQVHFCAFVSKTLVVT